MLPPILPPGAEGANGSRPGRDGPAQPSSRRCESPVEEQQQHSHSSEDNMGASAGDERMAFISSHVSSASSVSDDRTLNAASGSTASEQHLHNHEGVGISEDERSSHQKERAALPHGDAAPESAWEVWWMEIFSSILALGCIIALVVVLSIYQGQPLSRWPKLISVNSLIAISTAIFKASLILPVAEGLGQLKWNWFNRSRKLGDLVLFENACRGPWGSLLLLTRCAPRPDKGYLAGLGAFITIAALAIDPFSQAIINHRSCEITADFGLAQVPRTNNYSGDASRILNQQMLRAIYRGLVDPPKPGEFAGFTCTTGNCTFERDGGGSHFSSLGICHSCDDVTEKVVETSERDPSGDPTATWHLPWSVNITEERLYKDSYGGRYLTTRQTPALAYENSHAP
ncbi:hypothetical protein LZ31DRAFT_442935, partial [Colletotrichum somersetense]